MISRTTDKKGGDMPKSVTVEFFTSPETETANAMVELLGKSKWFRLKPWILGLIVTLCSGLTLAGYSFYLLITDPAFHTRPRQDPDLVKDMIMFLALWLVGGGGTLIFGGLFKLLYYNRKVRSLEWTLRDLAASPVGREVLRKLQLFSEVVAEFGSVIALSRVRGENSDIEELVEKFA